MDDMNKVAVSSKKSYSEPTVTNYGAIRDLTKSVGPKGGLDGGTGKTPPRTHA